jgi:4-diphosphocytidyl-2-C-methyl-D-erythritol kinase
MNALRLEAPAKLNLSLHVVARRPDGLHELVSRLVLLGLADRLLLLPGCSGLRVSPPGEEVPVAAPENLAWRGLVAGLGEEPSFACLTLDKQVPAAAGLGGGSSDAAAAWRLGRRWRGDTDVPTATDLESLSRIGADVPFFASATAAARVEGIGEQVTPTPPEPQDVLLVFPPFRLSTAAVFAELRPSDWTDPDAADPAHNDLLAPARRLRPELDDVFRRLRAAGGDAQLTGSGPTLFCLSDDPEHLDGIARRLEGTDLRLSRTRVRLEAASIEEVSDEHEVASPR